MKLFYNLRATNLQQRYSDYYLFVDGIGGPPEGHENIGYCSQIALFIRSDLLHERSEMNAAENNCQISPFPVEKFPYKLIFQYEFPVHVETRTPDEIALEKINMFFNTYLFRYDEEYYYNYEKDLYEFPLATIRYVAFHDAIETDEIKRILTGKYTIKNDVVEVPIVDEERYSGNSEIDFDESSNHIDELVMTELQSDEEIW